MALGKKAETRDMVLTEVDRRRIAHRLQLLEQRLTHYPEPLVTVRLTPHPTERQTQVDPRVRLGPEGADLISHHAAETIDRAVALAIDDVLCRQEHHHSALPHAASFGAPSRGEAREHRRQPVRNEDKHHERE